MLGGEPRVGDVPLMSRLAPTGGLELVKHWLEEG